MKSIDIELRRFAVTVEREAGALLEVASLWAGLKSGDLSVADAFFTTERWCLLLKCHTASEGLKPSPPKLSVRILEEMLCGESCKSLALTMLLAHSTVSQYAKQALCEMGLCCTPGRVHPMLALAAHAARYGRQGVQCRSALFARAGQSYRVASVRRPEFVLASRLAPAELDVVCSLVEGKPHSEIARSRGTSERTVANQLGAAFRRLGVSGRGELVQHLAINQVDEAA